MGMNSDSFNKIYSELDLIWKKNSVLSNFVKLPQNLKFNNIESNYIRSAKKFYDWEINTKKNSNIHNLIRELSPKINWKQNYREKEVGKEFLENFCYFEFIGPNGNFISKELSVYFIFFDKKTFYTWHHHEAEEIYFVLSGKAKFESIGDESKILGPNQARFHKSFQPHSLTTLDDRCLSIVVWKDKLDSEVSVVEI